ncbi:MAG: rhomboid family intramembrane serine protease [Pseudomonadota bacterium]
MADNHHIPAVNPLPPVVVALFLVIMGVEAAMSLGARGIVGGPEAIGWRLNWAQRYAFSPDIFDWMRERRFWPAEHMIRFVSYPFIHASFTHALFAGVIFLAMGKMTAERFGAVRMLIIFFASGIVGALAYALLLQTHVALIGAFPPVYGLIGAFTFMLWRQLSSIGANQTRAFSLIVVLMGVQLLFGLFFGGNGGWVADLAGFGTGFVLSFFLIPGGWNDILARVRRD